MTIANFPSALVPIIQTGFLERKFEQALRSKLAYRQIADKEPFPARIGETLTKTRAGLRLAATTPLTPSANTNFDNGLSSSTFAVEQYTLSINQYGDTVDLNVAADRVGIASQFVQNSITLGEQAARTLDTLAANALFNTYMGGNTRVRTTLGSANATISVDDIRGFQNTFSSTGQIVSVSSSNTLAVTVNGDSYTVNAVAADGSNVSTAPGGISGTLTCTANVTMTDGTAGNAVVSSIAPLVIRPSSRTTTAALTTGDTLTMVSCVMQAANTLRSNAVPDIGSLYNCYIDPLQLQGLFSDSAFQLLFRGAYQSAEYRQGDVMEIGGVRFISTNLAPQQTLSGKQIHRALVCGKGALVEGDVAGQDAEDTDNPLAEMSDVDGVRLITRAPMDRLQQIIAQSWRWIGGFVTPSDTTANPYVIPTATNSAYKRAIVVESL